MTLAFRTVTTSITILPEGASIFEENATRIEIRDDGAGPFLEISQTGLGAIVIEADNWPAIRDGVNKMIAVTETLPTQLSDEEIARQMTDTLTSELPNE